MEVILDAYFDEVFSRVARDYLLARHRRRQLADYFGHVIAGWCRAGVGDGDGGVGAVSPQLGAARAVLAAVRYHRKTKDDNGGTVCRMGKYHNILYVAARICVNWRLEDTDVVAELLREIYGCEHTLERIFVGAVLGPRATHVIAGWKSDFGDSVESLRCAEYFLRHAAAARMEFPVFVSKASISGGSSMSGDEEDLEEAEEAVEQQVVTRRAVDLPMPEYRRPSPLATAIQVSKPEAVLLFLRHGARFAVQGPTLHNENNPYDSEVPRPLVVFPRYGGPSAELCLRYVLRAVPLALPYPGLARADQSWLDLVYLTREDEGPACSIEALQVPPRLKHLSRCAIRRALWDKHLLPDGVQRLPLPPSLISYLDLMED